MKTRKLQNWILVADLLWISLALIIAETLRYGPDWYRPENAAGRVLFLPSMLAASTAWVVLSYAMQLDCFGGGWRFSATAAHLFLAVFFVMTVLLAGAYLSRQYVSRLALGYFTVLLWVGFLTLRWFAFAWLNRRYRVGNIRRVVIVGSGRVARELASKFERHPEMLCRVIGFLCPGTEMFESLHQADHVGGFTGISTLRVCSILNEHRVEELILALPGPAAPEVLNLAARCREQGIGVSVVPQPYELYLSKPHLLNLDGVPLLQLRDASASVLFLRWKRVLDLLVVCLLALVAVPILLPIALMLRWTTGHAFRWEKRCGLRGREFAMLRLNVDRDPQSGSRFERLLWQFSLTELPQFWNVLRGEMSLVGPRPESPDRVRHYSEWQHQRLSVVPGMTGLAQVHGLREQHSSEEKTRFDLQYLLQLSPLADLSLLLQTLGTLLMRLIWRPSLTTPEVVLPTAKELGRSKETSDSEVLHHAYRAQPSTD